VVPRVLVMKKTRFTLIFGLSMQIWVSYTQWLDCRSTRVPVFAHLSTTAVKECYDGFALSMWYSNLQSSPNIILVIKSRRMRWVGHVAHMGERRGIYRILVGKPGHRWKGNIKKDLQEVGWVAWTGLIWLRIGTC